MGRIFNGRDAEPAARAYQGLFSAVLPAGGGRAIGEPGFLNPDSNLAAGQYRG